jgi:conjugative transfer signal peptidase TraF
MSMNKTTRWACGIVAALFLAFAGFWFAGYRVVETASLPMGIWKLSPIPETGLQRGQVVHFCPPAEGVFLEAQNRGYLRDGWCPGNIEPLFKPVVALPGDAVTRTPWGLLVNGEVIEHSVALERDGHGDIMPVPLDASVSVVPEGRAWVVSGYSPYSFDSRYFGSIELGWVRDVAEPVWVKGTWP